ncbi:unnamed protein product [Spirodela intermedia]|uniref:Uncharacterized protein n=1 Tax=Spirodela intermedia TaxID=51605 RepID=A0A7I8JB41_SPIIN|nr:unnamed protein product [Spirodela intermedia]CAA6667438.1 unnamed protein product [Spirodela intermedia]
MEFEAVGNGSFLFFFYTHLSLSLSLNSHLPPSSMKREWTFWKVNHRGAF